MKLLLTPTQGRILRSLVLFLSKDSKYSVSPDSSIVVESIESHDWASLTFAGVRHRIVVRLPADAARVAFDDGVIEVPRAIVAVERAAWAAVADGQRLRLDLLAIATRSETICAGVNFA